MNRTLHYPPEMPNFKPYSVPSAHIQSGDGTIFHAALGSLGDDKSTFHVYAWTEKPDGTLTVVPLAEPPNNAPSFTIVNGKLVLHGVLESSPGIRTLVERDIPGYVVPAAVAGAQGPQGPRGATGPAGPQGPAGAIDSRFSDFLNYLGLAFKALLGMK